MPIITGKKNVLAVYAQAAELGWVIPCFCSENLTTTEAVIMAASEFAKEKDFASVPVTLAITNQYSHRNQSVYYTQTRRWDVGLELFYADARIVSEAFPNVKLMLHLDHAQYDTDTELLESDLSRYSSVMYDASALPLEQNIEKTCAFVKRKQEEILIEGACDEIVDAAGSARCEITDAAKCEDYMKRTGVDIVVANLGTEHRASGKTLHYYTGAANAIRERIGHRICLHGTSSVTNDEIRGLFADGICKVNIWTTLERDSSPVLTEFIVKNAAKCGGRALEEKLVREGYLSREKQTHSDANLFAFTTTARQRIVFEEMKRIVRGYLDLWYQ